MPAKYRFQLRSSNMEYVQDGDVLYLVGGYGSADDSDGPDSYRTFPNLTAVRVPELMQAVMAGNARDVEESIVTISDERMRVTGGGLRKLGDDFYLVFGHNFDKKYKGGLTGHYTCEVRRFRARFQAGALAITDYEALADPAGPGPDSQYHRRDLNVVESIRPDGSVGITAYGGVFTKAAGPWVRPVYVDRSNAGKTAVAVDPTFEQKTCQYDCGNLLMYDRASRTMYTTFFGGISFYYYDKAGKLVPSSLDNFMPFVPTITTLASGPDGRTSRVPQPPADSLPALLGADAVFIPDPGLARFDGSREVLDYGRLPAGKTVLVGRLLGGIRASEPQVSMLNPSSANRVIYEVYLTRMLGGPPKGQPEPRPHAAPGPSGGPEQ